MRLLRLILVCAALATPVAARAAPGDGPHQKTGPCSDFAHVHQVCGVSNPEDVGSLAGSPWLMVVEQAPPAGIIGMGALDSSTFQMIRFPADSFKPAPCAKMEGEPTCVMPAKPMFGGLGARRRPEGGWRFGGRSFEQQALYRFALDPPDHRGGPVWPIVDVLFSILGRV